MSPLIEEALKATVILFLIRLNRIGFLVDAAIMGFAVGTGFAVIENMYFLQMLPDTSTGIWIVRGFGTAIMHGGATAIFAVAGRALMSQRKDLGAVVFIPGLLVAAVIHSIFNHFFFSPITTTLGVLVVLPALMSFVFQQSEKSVEAWLDVGFDADTELLELINSGDLSESNVGEYLHSLKERFEGPVVADLLCYLRIHVELALRAKGLLMMRESGFEITPDDETRAKLEEMKFLEKSIGTTGKLAISPFSADEPKGSLAVLRAWQVDMTDSATTMRSIRSFVRRTGRMTPSQERALSELWPRFGIDYDDGFLDLDEVFGRQADRVLEIGFGNGDTLVQAAADHPEIDYVGIEVHEPGVGHCLLQGRDAGISNLRVIIHDAIDVLHDQIADSALSQNQPLFSGSLAEKAPSQASHRQRALSCSRGEKIAHGWIAPYRHGLAELRGTYRRNYVGIRRVRAGCSTSTYR